jgi:hypothetical protein
VRGAAFGGDFFVFVSAVAKHGWAKITNAPTNAVNVWRIMGTPRAESATVRLKLKRCEE